MLDRFTPEQIKASIVSDYGLPDPMIDRRAQFQGAQRVQLRKTGKLIDKLSTLTREESRVAYAWMSMNGSDCGDPMKSTYCKSLSPKPIAVKELQFWAINTKLEGKRCRAYKKLNQLIGGGAKKKQVKPTPR